MRYLLPITLLALAGCEKPNSGQDAVIKGEDDYTRHNPVGRYQMIPLRTDAKGAEQVVVLDTREGRITVCSAGGGARMSCSVGSPAFP